MAAQLKAVGKKTKQQIVKYKFTPKANLAAIAKSAEKVKALKTQAEILRMARKGMNPEEIAIKMGITAEEAVAATKVLVNRYINELSLSAAEHRQLDVSRVDSLLQILDAEIQPKEMKDDRGRPVIDAATLEPVVHPPNPIYVKLYLDVLERRSKLLGLDKLEEEQVKAIERRYVGVNPDDV